MTRAIVFDLDTCLAAADEVANSWFASASLVMLAAYGFKSQKDLLTYIPRHQMLE